MFNNQEVFLFQNAILTKNLNFLQLEIFLHSLVNFIQQRIECLPNQVDTQSVHSLSWIEFHHVVFPNFEIAYKCF